jgi:hypothetical protein
MKPTVSAAIERLRSVNTRVNASAGPDIHLREQQSAGHEDGIWGKPAGLETAGWHIGRCPLRRAAPQRRGTAGGALINRCGATHCRVPLIFPPEPPVAARSPSERPGAVKGAPALGAAQRTLDGEDRSGIASLSTGGLGGKITFPAGELRAGFEATFASSSETASGRVRTSNRWPDWSTAKRYATSFRATAKVAWLRSPPPLRSRW